MSTNTARASAHKVLLPTSELIKDIGCVSEIKTSVALCDQVRAVDRKAFDSRIGQLSQNAVLAIQLGLSYLFDIP